MIEKFLLENGWNILKEEDGMIFAERMSTGKHTFFIKGGTFDEFNEIEISRVWTKKGFHPFVYFEKEGRLTFYDFLFDEFVKNP